MSIKKTIQRAIAKEHIDQILDSPETRVTRSRFLEFTLEEKEVLRQRLPEVLLHSCAPGLMYIIFAEARSKSEQALISITEKAFTEALVRDNYPTTLRDSVIAPLLKLFCPDEWRQDHVSAINIHVLDNNGTASSMLTHCKNPGTIIDKITLTTDNITVPYLYRATGFLSELRLHHGSNKLIRSQLLTLLQRVLRSRNEIDGLEFHIRDLCFEVLMYFLNTPKSQQDLLFCTDRERVFNSIQETCLETKGDALLPCGMLVSLLEHFESSTHRSLLEIWMHWPMKNSKVLNALYDRISHDGVSTNAFLLAAAASSYKKPWISIASLFNRLETINSLCLLDVFSHEDCEHVMSITNTGSENYVESLLKSCNTLHSQEKALVFFPSFEKTFPKCWNYAYKWADRSRSLYNGLIEAAVRSEEGKWIVGRLFEEPSEFSLTALNSLIREKPGLLEHLEI